jgi:hypothetical protein
VRFSELIVYYRERRRASVRWISRSVVDISNITQGSQQVSFTILKVAGCKELVVLW